MPTGYTQAIINGADFKQFALLCARAFGATVLMRDEPMDAEIPEQFEPSTWHQERANEETARLHWLNTMSMEEAEDAAEDAYLTAMARYRQRIQEAEDTYRQYDTVLKAVLAWEPPSPDHIKLKEFMAEQITDAMDFDCDTDFIEQPPVQNGEEWRQKELNQAAWRIDYHREEQAKEEQRTATNNEWLRLLRESLR